MGKTIKTNMFVNHIAAAVLALVMFLAGIAGNSMEVQAASTTAYTVLSSTKYAKVYKNMPEIIRADDFRHEFYTPKTSCA